MTKIMIRQAEGKWVVRSGGAVLGETTEALELHEGDLAPVIYFPRNDIAMALLDRTEATSEDPTKGEAVFFDIVNMSSITEKAAWSYESPSDALAQVKDHLAFKVQESVKVEQV